MSQPFKSGAHAVDLATRADEADLMEMCRLLHAENGLFPIDEDMVRAMLWRAFDGQGGIIGVIRGTDTPIEGVIYILISRFWYSTQTHLEELFNFVHPDHRQPPGRAGALIEFAKECASRLAIPLVIGVVSNERTEAKVRLYQRKLGPPAGAFFLYSAAPAATPEIH